MRRISLSLANPLAPFRVMALLMALLVPASPLSAQPVDEQAMEVMPGIGAIDWRHLTVSATGFGAFPMEALSQAQGSALAERAAIVDARRNLLEVVLGVRIQSQTLVADAVAQDEMIRADLLGLLQNSRVVRTETLSDGSVQVLVAMPMPGMLEQEIRSLDIPDPIRTELPPTMEPHLTIEAGPDPFLPELADMYTGLVVDARGLGFVPSLTPELFLKLDLLYPGDAAGDSFAATRGLARYFRNIDQAQQSEQAGDMPLTIQALSLGPGGESSLVLDDRYADLLRKVTERPDNFLSKCNVVVVF